MFKIKRQYLPIKAHFFFFFAAMGPLLPQMNVYGKQLGISPVIMGIVMSILPIFWALAKPAIGFLVDYFHASIGFTRRKLVFLLLIIFTSGSYLCIYFLPNPPVDNSLAFSNMTMIHDFKQQVWVLIKPCSSNFDDSSCTDRSDLLEASCGWICNSKLKSINATIDRSLDFWIKVDDVESDSKYLTEIFYDNSFDKMNNCEQLNMDNFDFNIENNLDRINETKCKFKKECKFLSCAFIDKYVDNINLTMKLNNSGIYKTDDYNLYTTITFWGFVIYMCVGTVCYNVANCISDAICLDILGTENEMKYGFQRAWGTAGYGLTALISGYLVDYVTGDKINKDFTPAFIIMTVCTLIDLYFCRDLKLPSMSSPKDAGGHLMNLIKKPSVMIFIVFATFVGIFDSFLIYYMFWFMEEIALETNQYSNIKFLEGLTIAGECFGGEILFFAISGKILKALGYRNTLTLGLLFYTLRIFCISMITQPWHFILVATFLQGPTYALCYSTIVGYAASIAPPGMSATLQGIFAGVDDGIGFLIGSLIGGILYNWIGGRNSFRVMSVIAIITVLLHFILSKIVVEYKYTPEDDTVTEEKDLMENRNNIRINPEMKASSNESQDAENKLLSRSENV